MVSEEEFKVYVSLSLLLLKLVRGPCHAIPLLWGQPRILRMDHSMALISPLDGAR